MPLRRNSFVRAAFALFFLCAAAVSAAANPRLLIDSATGEVLFAEQAGQPWHPASLTKLMTAYVTFEAIAEGRLDLSTPVIMTAKAAKEPPAKIGLPVDTGVRLEDALYVLLVKSANDMAVAIAQTVSGSEDAFVSEMNAKAAELGLSATHYNNPNGLDDPGQVTTARDLAVLAMAIRSKYPQYADMFRTEEVRLGKSRLRSENNLLTEFSGTTGMKTGYLCASGLNIVATAERGQRSLLAVVLGAVSSRERGEMTAELMLRGFSGELSGTGVPVTAITDEVGAEPVDLRTQVCGKSGASYRAERKEAYPYGLDGQVSFLTDKVPPVVHSMLTLGRLRDVPLPLVRPADAPQWSAPVDAADDGVNVPIPRARPVHLGAIALQ